ncbi:MAG: phytoene/squalene synthase family protein [Beijerinckiaceae bacterium]|nr:phytoene/squalene synthase family protein [Beijerinckiaceae bacterium]
MSRADGDTLAAAYALCETSLREGTAADRDAWLASLFIAPDKRPHVQALYAFSREIARVPSIVSQPTLGEIRLQWWVEALEGLRKAEAEPNPLAAALFDTITRFNLPTAALVALIEARHFDLYADPMPTLNDLEGYCGEAYGGLMRLASIVVADGRDPGGGEAVGHASVAIGVARILAGLPLQAARGQCFIPLDVLARHGALPEAVAAGLSSPALEAVLSEMRSVAHRHAQAALGAAPLIAPQARVVLLPLAVVGPMLARMERRGFDPFRDVAEPPQWRRQWALWRAARKL